MEALHDVKKGTLYNMLQLWYPFGLGAKMQRDWRIIVMDAAKKSTGRGHLENKQYSIIKYYA